MFAYEFAFQAMRLNGSRPRRVGLNEVLKSKNGAQCLCCKSTSSANNSGSLTDRKRGVSRAAYQLDFVGQQPRPIINQLTHGSGKAELP